MEIFITFKDIKKKCIPKFIYDKCYHEACLGKIDWMLHRYIYGTNQQGGGEYYYKIYEIIS